MLSFRKNTIIKNKISDYFRIVAETSDFFLEAATYHLSNGCTEEFKILMKRVIKKESEADDLRREIEAELYRKSLLPEIRQDILLTIDQLDELPDKAEDIVKMIYNQNIRIPNKYVQRLEELLSLGAENVKLLTKAAEEAIGQNKNVKELVREIDDNESHGDRIEHELIHDLFHQPEISITTMLLKEYIEEVGSILDIAQKVADTMTLISIKRII